MTPSNWVWRTARETSESAWTPPKFTEIPLMTNAMSVPHRGVRPEPSGANVTDLTMVRTHIGRYGRCAQIWWCKALQKSNRPLLDYADRGSVRAWRRHQGTDRKSTRLNSSH